MSSTTFTEVLWVVLDTDDRVVVICAGADAEEAAGEWRNRGFRVRCIGDRGAPAA